MLGFYLSRYIPRTGGSSCHYFPAISIRTTAATFPRPLRAALTETDRTWFMLNGTEPGKIPELATTGEPETMLPRAMTDADALSLKPI